jgi:hypothetical protein
MPRKTKDLNVISGPTCQHLRSKGMYVSGQRELAEGIGDGHCWCNKTQHVLGPDDGLVSRTRCDATRRCFQAVL